MLRFLFGIFVLQLATVGLVLLAPDNLSGLAWLRLIIPIIFIGVFTAFWFSTIAKHKSKEELSVLEQRHAKEREKLQVNAERAKTRLIKKTQKEIAREAKITHGKANFKVGAALAGVMGLGALMLLTQFLTLGIVTLTTAGGVLGGYFYRGRKEQKNRFLEQQTVHPIVLEGGTTDKKQAKLLK
jgi:Flp pilus assembly protein TadB